MYAHTKEMEIKFYKENFDKYLGTALAVGVNIFDGKHRISAIDVENRIIEVEVIKSGRKTQIQL